MSTSKAHLRVQSHDGYTTTAEREAAGSFTQADGTYYNPYYDWGNGAMSAIGQAMATINWNEVTGWAIIVIAYIFLSGLSVWVWNPFMICIFATQGDLKNCSLGIWGNAYKNPDELCEGRTWHNKELTDAEAQCYYTNNSGTLQGFDGKLCDLKIHYDNYGYDQGLSYAC